jgi:plasmid stabilization system protein ParE
VKGFQSYLIFYRPAGDDLEVVRFLHGARDLPRLLEDET